MATYPACLLSNELNQQEDMNCAKLSGNLAMASCGISNPALLGEMILINFEDWQGATITYDTTDVNVITGIALASGKKGVKLTSHEKAFEGSYSMNKGTYVNSYIHSIIARAFERSQEVKDALNIMLHGRFVAVVHNVSKKDIKTAFEVYGAENGLLASAIEGNTTDADGMIAQATLASDDAQRESKLPASFCVKSSSTYSYEATKTAFDGLADED